MWPRVRAPAFAAQEPTRDWADRYSTNTKRTYAMKIGIITFHDTANFGAALQTYATVEWLCRAGHEAVILDYTNSKRQGSYQVNTRFRRQLRNRQFASALATLAGGWFIRRRIGRFDAFYREYTPRTPEPLGSRDALVRYARTCDAIIAGSDQIWNPRNNGDDSTYLLDFVDDPARTVSYASSFGAVDLLEHDRTVYSRLLARIQALSVREPTAAELVRELTGRSAPVVVDPVVLLPAEEWRRLADDETDYPTGLLDYTASPGMLESFLRTTRLKRRFQTITRNGSAPRPRDLLTPGVKLAGSDGPLQFLGRLLRADLLFTSSFHATVFAILLRRPFVSVLSGNPGRTRESLTFFRIWDLPVASTRPPCLAAMLSVRSPLMMRVIDCNCAARNQSIS
jgi:PHD/YefM family antitoxin component YafN of YafNO toxin-antitoxin module